VEVVLTALLLLLFGLFEIDKLEEVNLAAALLAFFAKL
jgi:hypothetical protein